MINSLQLEFFGMINQSLVNLVVIDGELDKKDHDLISHNYNWEKIKIT
jgi:hypothetical protein